MFDSREPIGRKEGLPIMTPEEEAYEEALRRIREAEETGALELDLSQLALNRLPPELESLTPLQELDLSLCFAILPRWRPSPRSNRSTSTVAAREHKLLGPKNIAHFRRKGGVL
jgi:hypothetical protein